MNPQPAVKLSVRQRKVLDALYEADAYADYSIFLDGIAERSGLDRRAARIAVRALKRKGLAELLNVFDEGTGLVAGSGYMLTRAGLEAARTIE